MSDTVVIDDCTEPVTIGCLVCGATWPAIEDDPDEEICPVCPLEAQTSDSESSSPTSSPDQAAESLDESPASFDDEPQPTPKS